MKRVMIVVLLIISLFTLSSCDNSGGDIDNEEITNAFFFRQLLVAGEYATNKEVVITSNTVGKTYYFEDDVTRATLIYNSEKYIDETNKYFSETIYQESNIPGDEYYDGKTTKTLLQEEGNKLIRYTFEEDNVKSSTEYPMSTEMNFRSEIEMIDDNILDYSSDFYDVINYAFSEGSSFYKINENTYEGSVPHINLIDSRDFSRILNLIETKTVTGVEDDDFVTYSIIFSEDNRTININIEFDYVSELADNVYVSVSQNIEIRILDEVPKITLDIQDYLVEAKTASKYVVEIMESNSLYTLLLSELSDNWYRVTLEPGTYKVLGIDGIEFSIFNQDRLIEYVLNDENEFIQDSTEESMYYFNLEVDTETTTIIEFRKTD